MLNSDFFESVSFNCDVSDANYWGYFSICTLLLRLRELFKIERNLEPWDHVENSEIYPWIEKKEEIWRKLENSTLIPIKLNKEFFCPFEIDKINENILKSGFVYGAGYALYMKPSFFVGLISEFEEIEGYKVYHIEKEIVRDLFSSPGMSVNKTIYIRLTDIKHRLWEDIHGWIRKKDSLSEILISKFGNPSEWNPPYEKFEKIVQSYSKIVLHHEIAEQEESCLKWSEMLKNCSIPKTENILRGIRDFIADFSPKGPINRAVTELKEEMLALYLLAQGPYQKKILKIPLQQIKEALILGNWGKIDSLRNKEFERWQNIQYEVLKIYDSDGVEGVKKFTDKIFEGGTN